MSVAIRCEKLKQIEFSFSQTRARELNSLGAIPIAGFPTGECLLEVSDSLLRLVVLGREKVSVSGSDDEKLLISHSPQVSRLSCWLFIGNFYSLVNSEAADP